MYLLPYESWRSFEVKRGQLMATIDSQTDSELVLHDWEGSNRSRAVEDILIKRLAETSSNYKSVA